MLGVVTTFMELKWKVILHEVNTTFIVMWQIFISRPYSTENIGTVYVRRLPDHTCQKFSLTLSETIATHKAQARSSDSTDLNKTIEIDCNCDKYKSRVSPNLHITKLQKMFKLHCHFLFLSFINIYTVMGILGSTSCGSFSLITY